MRGSTRRSSRTRRSGSSRSRVSLRLLGYLLAFMIGATSAGVGFLAAMGALA